MATFNLKNYLVKQANYEGIQGYFVAQTRSWQNCVRAKLNKGASAQDAWQGCVDDYQKSPNNMDWISKNTHEDELKKSAQYGAQFQMGSYWHKIKKHQKNGLTVAQAVMEALKECEQEAIPLHESANNQVVKTAGNAGKLLGLPGVLDVPSSRGGVTTVVVDEKMEQGFLANLASRGFEQVGNQPFRSPNGVVFQVRETPIAKRPALNQTAESVDEHVVGQCIVHGKNFQNDCDKCGYAKWEASHPKAADKEVRRVRKQKEATACKECGCGHPGEEHGGKCTCPASCDCRQPGGSCYEKKASVETKIVQAEKWMQDAAKEMKEKGTEGDFTSYCGGKVTQECIDRAKAEGGHRAKQAQFAENARKISKNK